MPSPDVHMPRRYRLWTNSVVPSNCYDGLYPPVQLNGALNLGGGGSFTDWGNYGGPALSDMVIHQGVPWVVHVDVVDPDVGDGPYVQFWDGAAWQDAGFPAGWDASFPTPTDGVYSHPAGCAIASDGTSIFVAFEAVYYNCGTPERPPGCCEDCNLIDHRTLFAWTSHVPCVWKWDGASWSFQQSWGPQVAPTDDGVLYVPVGWEWIFVANLQWTEASIAFDFCPLNVGPVGDQLSRPLLAAKDDDFIVVWRQTWREWTLDTACADCLIPGDPCLVTTSRSHVDGMWYGALNSDGSRTDYGFYPDVANNGGPRDIVWDADTATPLLLHYTGEIGRELLVLDATDGTTIQSQADSRPTRFSSPWSGLRYISGHDLTQAPTTDTAMWQLPSDASAGLDPFEADIAFQPVGAQTEGRPLPEDSNVWLLGIDNGVSKTAQFNRLCDPKFWVFLGQTVPVAGYDRSIGPNFRTDILGEFIYVSYLHTAASPPSFIHEDPEHQVWRIRICRCCETCPEPPPEGCANDDFANATLLVGASGSNDDCTAMEGNTTEVDEPVGSCLSNGIHHTVWFEWVAPADGNVTFDTGSSMTFDSTLTVYTGTNFADMVEVACNDDFGGGGLVTSSVTFTASSGVTYWIQVGLFGDDITGALVLSWSQ